MPRESIIRQQEKEISKIPPVGGYRPKHEYIQSRLSGKIAYGPKEQWQKLGQD